MSDSEPPTKHSFGQVDSNRRTVLKLLGAGVGLSAGGLSAGSVLTSATASADTSGLSNGDPGVDPQTVSVQLAPGESTTIRKTVTAPEIPPVADIFILEDETGSFKDDIANLQSLAPSIWDDIEATGTDFTMGVGGFRDFAQLRYGEPGNDWVYDRYQDLTTDKSQFLKGVNSLTADGGLDDPEAYLDALDYIADTVTRQSTATGTETPQTHLTRHRACSLAGAQQPLGSSCWQRTMTVTSEPTTEAIIPVT